MRTLALALVCACSPLAAQDYLSHQENFEMMAKAVMAKQSCKRFGYIVDDKAIQSLADDTIVNAVKDGVPLRIARIMAQSAIKEEEQKQDFILNNAKSKIGDSKTEEEKSAALSEFLRYWAENCEILSQDIRIGRFFLPPPQGLKNPFE